MSGPRVVGLDLSLTATGCAGPAHQISWTIRSKLKGCERLAFIREEVMRLCAPVERWEPTWHMDAPLVVLEDYAFSRAAAHSHQLGELGGVVRLALHEAGVPFVAVVPSSLKKYATGKGNANKGEMLAAAIRRLGYEGADDNEADALWLRAMGLDALGAPLVKLPESHRVALGKVAWPS